MGSRRGLLRKLRVTRRLKVGRSGGTCTMLRESVRDYLRTVIIAVVGHRSADDTRSSRVFSKRSSQESMEEEGERRGTEGHDRRSADGQPSPREPATTTFCFDPLAVTVALASFLGVIPVGRGLAAPGTWCEVRTIASATVGILSLTTLIVVFGQELLEGPSMQEYTTIQRLAELMYICVNVFIVALLMAHLWRRGARLLSLVFEAGCGVSCGAGWWGQAAALLVPPLIQATFYGRWYVIELHRSNIPLTVQAVFVAAFSWAQVLAAVPFLFHLLVSSRVTARFAALDHALGHALPTPHSHDVLAFEHALLMPDGRVTSQNHPQRWFTTVHPGYQPMAKGLLHNSTTDDKPIYTTRLNQECAGDSGGNRQRGSMGARKRDDVLLQFASEHQRLRDVYSQLSDVLGPAVLFSHLFFVYTIIMAVFTLVFNFEMMVASDVMLLVGIAFSCLTTPAALFLSGAAADRLTHQASAHLPRLVLLCSHGWSHAGNPQEVGVVLAATSRPVQFSVCGLYTLGRANLPAIVQAVTSYLVILLQFYFSELYK
ncbi:uncharacterized protein [Panulirus ornatus]|uniref:uncharacterized protein n=1 Tax=Panulirus ornatus TaxID=150431 RepID=UPI003A89DF0F